MKPLYAIGSVPSLSGHAITYRWRSLPRVLRHRASKPQGSSERVLPWQITMCVCVFFPSILDIKFVGRTSRGHTGGRSHRIFNPPSFCGACLDFCREKDSAIPFPRRPCVLCVFFPSILDINGRTSRGHTGGRSHRIFNPPSFCGACLDFCREKDSAIPFPRRP